MNQETKSLQIPKETHRELKRFCDERGLKISHFVNRLIRKAIQGKLIELDRMKDFKPEVIS